MSLTEKEPSELKCDKKKEGRPKTIKIQDNQKLRFSQSHVYLTLRSFSGVEVSLEVFFQTKMLCSHIIREMVLRKQRDEREVEIQIEKSKEKPPEIVIKPTDKIIKNMENATDFKTLELRRRTKLVVSLQERQNFALKERKRLELST